MFNKRWGWYKKYHYYFPTTEVFYTQREVSAIAMGTREAARRAYLGGAIWVDSVCSNLDSHLGGI